MFNKSQAVATLVEANFPVSNAQLMSLQGYSRIRTALRNKFIRMDEYSLRDALRTLEIQPGS